MTLLRIEKNNGIATVSLNRPDKRNAMSFARSANWCAPQKNLKKTVDNLTGEANVFSAGIDLADLNNPQTVHLRLGS